MSQFLNGMPGREWTGSPTNSNALSSSYFTSYYYSFGGGLLDNDDELVARDVLLGVLPCN